jgi:hypothetical protein
MGVRGIIPGQGFSNSESLLSSSNLFVAECETDPNKSQEWDLRLILDLYCTSHPKATQERNRIIKIQLRVGMK